MSLSHEHAAEVNANIIKGLRAENARLQEQVEEAIKRGVMLWQQFVWLLWAVDRECAAAEQAQTERDGYKALAKVRGEALKAIEDGNWAKLIDIAGLANDKEFGLLINYELEGDYEADARHNYPRRMKLLREAARATIAMTPEEALAKERQGE